MASRMSSGSKIKDPEHNFKRPFTFTCLIPNNAKRMRSRMERGEEEEEEEEDEPLAW
jgi:hypothetical protein